MQQEKNQNVLKAEKSPAPEQGKTVKAFWNEQWKKVDFGGATKNCDYQISNFGRIKSVDKASRYERLLKGAKARGGLIMLNQKLKDNSTGIIYIHRFVAEEFLPQPSPKHEYILHIDYDKSNNKVNNLKWATEEEWKEYQKKNPHHKGRPARTKNYKLTETQVRLMKKMLLRGKTKRKIIARKFGVSENCAYKIEKGIRWAHINIDDED